MSTCETRTDRSLTLARVEILVPVSIVIPTYREAENIPHILSRLKRMRERAGVDLEVIFMDDDSGDGSEELVRSSGCDWATFVVRSGPRSLSAAVVDGFRRASHPVIVCMDCDLSHPPEVIPRLVLALESGQEMVLGSRYVPGGSTDDDWGIFRWFNSRVATVLARPLTSARDPMAGFFAMRRADFEAARDLNPIGYKIALELIVKCGLRNVGEVPIHFADRVHGESKLTIREQLKYIQHLRRLYIHRFGTAMDLLQFLAVGASGLVVNLLVLTLLSLAGAADPLALAGGIGVSVISNFLLNRRFTFSYARHRSPWRQFGGFLIASAIGMVVNYSVALWLDRTVFDGVVGGLHLSAMCGVLAGLAFNFAGNRFVVFRRTVVRPRGEDRGS